MVSNYWVYSFWATWAQNECNMTQKTKNVVTELDCRLLFWHFILYMKAVCKIALVISKKHIV